MIFLCLFYPLYLEVKRDLLITCLTDRKMVENLSITFSCLMRSFVSNAHKVSLKYVVCLLFQIHMYNSYSYPQQVGQTICFQLFTVWLPEVVDIVQKQKKTLMAAKPNQMFIQERVQPAIYRVKSWY